MIYLYAYLAASVLFTAWAAYRMRDVFDTEALVLIAGVLVTWPILLPIELVAWRKDRRWQAEVRRENARRGETAR